MKEIQNLITYLKEIEKLSSPLDKKQQQQLGNVIKVILILLVSLKKVSNLGNIKSPFHV